MRNFLKNFLLFTGSVVVFLVLAELTLRMVGVHPATENFDRTLGYAPAPHQVSKWNFPEYGPNLVKRTNSVGFHEDADVPADKPPGVRRIIFVGDSQTEGLCPNPESYPHQLQALLNESAPAGTRYEVLNAAVGGFSPYQYYLRARRDAVPFHPDGLVVAIYVGNDLVDLTRRDSRPYLSIDGTGAVIEHAAGPVPEGASRVSSFIGRSHLFSLTLACLGPNIRYQVTRAQMLLFNAGLTGHGIGDVMSYMFEVGRLGRISANMMTQSLQQQVWFRHFPDTLPAALKMNRYVMKQLRDLCDKDGIQLSYIFIPTKLSIEPEDINVFPLFVKSGYNPASVAAFEGRVTAEMMADCSSLGIPAVDLKKALQDRKNGSRLYYPIDMHLSVAGNRKVAEALFAALPHDSERQPTRRLSAKLTGAR